MVFDSNFNILSENKINSTNYNYAYDWTTIGESIMLLHNKIYNPDTDDEYLKADLLAVDKMCQSDKKQ